MSQAVQTPPAAGEPQALTSRRLSGSSARTRRAILDAAYTALADSPSASLGAIADAAGVGRTTLHRYFADRNALVDALSADALERMQVMHARARLEEGTALDAITRLAAEYFDSIEVMRLIWREVIPADAVNDYTGHAEQALRTRGHADGTIDQDLDEVWFFGLIGAHLFLANEVLLSGLQSRQDVRTKYLRAAVKAVGAN